MILVDTSVLSLAYRHRRRVATEPRAVSIFRRLVFDDMPVAIPGIVFQEVLSGIRIPAQVEKLKRTLESFPIQPATTEHHIAAARIANDCRRRGVTVASVDCLIAAQASCDQNVLFTLDQDFSRIARVCNLKLLALEIA